MRARLLLVVAALASSACSDCGGGGAGPDASTPVPTCSLAGVDPKCGSPCFKDEDCPATLFCSNGKCAAECVLGTAPCPVGDCVARGRCQVPSGADAGAGGDAGAALDGGGPKPDGGDCARTNVTATVLIPTVVLLIDQSLSMTENFDGQTRWEAVKKALTDPTNGAVTKLQAKVRFGATLYTSDGAGTCPDLTAVDPALNNAAPITQLLANNAPKAETPTGESLDQVATKLHGSMPIEGGDGPRLIVLATDGEPDTCAIPAPKDVLEQEQTRNVAVAAVRKAFQWGLKTYVLSVGTQVAATHLQDLANAGTGTAAGANAPYYVANSPADLVAAFNTIIRGARVCEFLLSGQVVAGQEATGEVKLDGRTLAYNDPNGWKLKDPKTLELLGTACDAYKNTDSPTLTASFACGSIQPQ